MPTDTAQPIHQPDANPVSKYAADAWLSSGIGGSIDLTVPSGQLCLVRRPGVEGLVAAGVLRNIDSLTSLVQDKHLKGGKRPNDRKPKKSAKDEAPEIDVAKIMEDPEALENIIHTVDRVVCHCVIAPEVHMTPSDVTRRKPGVVYADMIDLMDKMFIFNFVVGGTRDLESFRGGLGELVGGVEALEGVRSTAE